MSRLLVLNDGNKDNEYQVINYVIYGHLKNGNRSSMSRTSNTVGEENIFVGTGAVQNLNFVLGMYTNTQRNEIPMHRIQAGDYSDTLTYLVNF